MKTLRIRIDELLLEQLDDAARDLSVTRSAFVRQALQAALRRHRTHLQERQHAEGYARRPAGAAECEEWLPEQDWGAA